MFWWIDGIVLFMVIALAMLNCGPVVRWTIRAYKSLT